MNPGTTNTGWLIVVSQSLHGLAYVFFIIAGQIFADKIAPPEIRSSVQAPVFAATVGVGLFLGTQFAGFVMDASAADGKFQWRRVWMVPGTIMLLGVLALATLLREPPAEKQGPPPKAAAEVDTAAVSRHVQTLPEA